MKPDPGLMLRRRIVNRLMTGLFLLATTIAVGALAVILWKLVVAGVAALSPMIFLRGTPAPGGKGGLINAILGSVAMTLIAIVVATPIAVLAGTYLAEYGRGSRLGHVVRFLNDTLLSAPSIIIGLFIYGVIVLPAGHFSGWAGAAALALIALPVIVRTSEDMMRLIPDSLREAAVALGCPYWRMVVSVGWRAARSGILTGILLAVARISGETAPLLFTSLNNQFVTTNMNAPMASLPVVIFQFAMSPYRDWQRLAWAGALLITFGVLLLNMVARTIASRGASR
jgi:phosphate transport system permease protein